MNRIAPLAAATLGALSLTLAAPSFAVTLNPADTSVQMFRWKWNDIAKECTNGWARKAMARCRSRRPGVEANGWWDVYQPVNYSASPAGSATRPNCRR